MSGLKSLFKSFDFEAGEFNAEDMLSRSKRDREKETLEYELKSLFTGMQLLFSHL